MTRVCDLCGFRADFYCLECEKSWCYEHVIKRRDAWGYRCTASPDNHAFVPIIQEGKENLVKATNPKEGLAEGRRFGKLLRQVFNLQDNPDFQAVSGLAQYLAIDVLGYRDAEIANAYTRGFVAALIGSPDELSDEYAAGNMTVEQLTKAIGAALQLQQQQQQTEGKLQMLKGEIEGSRERPHMAPPTVQLPESEETEED